MNFPESESTGKASGNWQNVREALRRNKNKKYFFEWYHLFIW